MTEKLDLDSLAAGINPSGLDPEIEKKAEEYAKREWQMSVKPMLDAVFTNNNELPITTIAELQNALFEHKYTVLLNADNKRTEAKKHNLRW